MPRRLSLWMIPLIAAVLVIAYAGYWWLAAGEMRASVDRWVSDWRKAGYSVEHGDIVVTGFPFAVEADIPRPRIAEGQGVWSWSSMRAGRRSPFRSTR